MNNIVVIDTETTWGNQVMSLGAVIADGKTFEMIDSKYYIFTPEYKAGGMYTNVLHVEGIPVPLLMSRVDAMADMRRWFLGNGVKNIMAYNAAFDKKHLPELGAYRWFDIMRLAAYKQYNPMIPANSEFCKTGRLKRDYGVEPILRLLSGNHTYEEVHNAWYDAFDELQIVKLLGHPLEDYAEAEI